MDQEQKRLGEIELARLELIGLSLAALGDGIAALAAAIALEALENEYRTPYPVREALQLETTQQQLDYYIHQLVQIKQKLT
ncbi:translation initiation factor 2 [Paenibacillus soyae]|uniref:Translation initiation factor 2 n=1 Tax=Paenibacillus soyae TaxID=2969249 RepID=A0A9X2MWA0_9BACL|nr:translation initiation factor 2 [Paenibacillus soyae]MCR2808044.1 translation initiation factor 2 [Paenibacillus soyae]